MGALEFGIFIRTSKWTFLVALKSQSRFFDRRDEVSIWLDAPENHNQASSSEGAERDPQHAKLRYYYGSPEREREEPITLWMNRIIINFYSHLKRKYKMDMSVAWILWSRGIRVQFNPRDNNIRFGSTPTAAESKPLKKEGGDSTAHTCPKGPLIFVTIVILLPSIDAKLVTLTYLPNGVTSLSQCS